jgi:hypothetical protein
MIGQPFTRSRLGFSHVGAGPNSIFQPFYDGLALILGSEGWNRQHVQEKIIRLGLASHVSVNDLGEI